MYYQRLLAPVALVFGLLSGPTAYAQTSQELPEGKGKAQFMQICSQCHGLAMVTSHRNTADGWSAVIDDMVSRGAQGTDDDFDLVIKYLAANFGLKVNINKASASDLSSALQISSADAAAIIHYRETAGEFKDWSDLEKVPHIDIKKLESEKDRIEFSSKPASAGASK
ncbi:MAG TPA: helix-hairpin-helix domain-containing protein [Bryobacteraceae bacterium]|jgi:competence ComEA-like helix-hairpin-helix protein|nr:helix-hairpin-helix domain-containing protein [Bryobacteraceae bacterium]